MRANLLTHSQQKANGRGFKCPAGRELFWSLILEVKVIWTAELVWIRIGWIPITQKQHCTAWTINPKFRRASKIREALLLRAGGS